jgi:mono/diheme cytochrome c family protein
VQLSQVRYYIIVISLAVFIFFFYQCSTTKVDVEEDTSILLATNTRPLRDIKYERTAERIERGEYLTNGILKCFVCHSPRDTFQTGFPPIESKKGSGAIIWEIKPYRMVAPNITPDKETGAGNWTDDMFARAIREGIGHDGRALSLPMYWASFRELSDEDLASVIVYLRSIPAVKNKLPKRKLSLETEKELQTSSNPLQHGVKSIDLSDPLTRGKYLVKVADCVGCHTGWYKRNPGFFGGGNKLKRIYDTSYVFSSNITPDSTGLQSWTPEFFIQLIRTGKHLKLDPVMPWVSYMNMTDDDLKAILMALKQLPPVNHKVMNEMTPTFCEICEQSHGYGEYNKIIALKPVSFNRSLYPEFAGTYVHRDGYSIEVTLENKKLYITEGGPKYELIPVAENRFEASGFSTPVSFKRDATGKVKWLISYWIEEDLFEKKSN